MKPLEAAEELIARWETELGHRAIGEPGDPEGTILTIHMTNDVRDLMRDDIVRLMNEVIRTPSAYSA